MTEQTIFPDFERDAWPLYERKGKKKLAKKEWDKLSQKDKEAAYDGIAPYIRSRPIEKHRLDFERYIKYRTWEDKIIDYGTDTSTKNPTGPGGSGAHTKMREILQIIARGSSRGDDDHSEGGIL